MSRVTKRISKKAGLPPGALVYTGEKKVDKVKVEVFDYKEAKFEEKEIKNPEECFRFRDKPTVTWINVVGLHEPGVIAKIGSHYGLHPLVMEDILNINQHSKIEFFDDYVFVVLKMIYFEKEKNEINIEQVSIVIGANFVISFQEIENEFFDSVKQRIRNENSRTRKMGADYLAYMLIDAIVDSYFVALEKIGEEIEDIEDELLQKPTVKTANKIHKFKRELTYLRKSVWPLREVIYSIQREETKIIKRHTYIYFRDIYDHAVQIIDTTENLKDIVASMLEVYLSSISIKMNETMKILTIIATIFIPLTFLVGIYGMNFRYMPELEWQLSYPIILIAMVIIGFSMYVYFKKRGWA